MKRPETILVATKNQGKIKELRDLLLDLSVNLLSLTDFPMISDVEETGRTFADNAALKAVSYSLQTGLWSISDDSGLEVEALGGAPGIYSARYGGSLASDDDRIQKLLTELSATGNPERRSRFVCAVAVSDETGRVRFAAEGICNGRIAEKPRGSQGFGYDPIFVPEGFNQTFGELSRSIKQEMSHRARAIAKIIGFLRDFPTNQLDLGHLGL